MANTFEIISSSRNKIELGLTKEKFVHLKFEKRYLKSNAFNLALLASAAYLELEDVRAVLFDNNSPVNRVFDSIGAGNVKSCFLSDSEERVEEISLTFDMKNDTETDTQFFHFKTSEYLLLSFRGTEKKVTDALTDANAGMVRFSEVCGMVHKGFHEAFKAIEEYLDTIVDDANGLNVILCGHSLGGALATLAAAYIRKKFKREVLLYTFGCPLVGDADFAHYCSKADPITHFRFVHNRDIVTMIPPPHSHLRLNLLVLALQDPLFLIPATYDPFGKPFNHFGTLVFIRRIGQNAFSVDVDRKTPAYIRIPKEIPVVESMEERPKWERLLNWAGMSTADHSMVNYISILGSDLKAAIDLYLSTGRIKTGDPEKIAAYLESEIQAIEERKADLETHIARDSSFDFSELGLPLSPPALNFS